MKASTKKYLLQTIKPQDIDQVARLIRTVMEEYGCVGEGYSYVDPEVDDMFSFYNNGRSEFYVIYDSENENKILGCGGIAPLKGGNEEICELRKMYFYPELRGQGMGHQMIEKCLEAARNLGYKYCYLETVERMETANYLYQKMGFRRNTEPMGDTGHHVCESYYVRPL
jgi:putative acetyltransferase